MPFLIVNQPQQKLKAFLDRRIEKTAENQSSQKLDHSMKKKQKTNSRKKFKRSKRFNTTLGQRCDFDFRLQTFYQPSIQFTFTGLSYKTKFHKDKQIRSTSVGLNYKNVQNINQKHKFHEEMLAKQLKQKKQHNRDSQIFQNKEFDLTKSCLITSQEQKQQKNRSRRLKTQIKFRITNPTPVKQTQFLVNLKKDFIKRHIKNKKQKKSQKNDLIKIQDYISQKKQTFKRNMETQLIRIGEAKLLSQIQERKGKIYLGGLHNLSKKKKQVENIDQLLRKSRGSFSTPNNLLAHLKLTSQKKKKLQNIKKLKQKTMNNCLEKIKSLSIKSEMFSCAIQVK